MVQGRTNIKRGKKRKKNEDSEWERENKNEMGMNRERRVASSCDEE